MLSPGKTLPDSSFSPVYSHPSRTRIEVSGLFSTHLVPVMCKTMSIGGMDTLFMSQKYCLDSRKSIIEFKFGALIGIEFNKITGLGQYFLAIIQYLLGAHHCRP